MTNEKANEIELSMVVEWLYSWAQVDRQECRLLTYERARARLLANASSRARAIHPRRRLLDRIVENLDAPRTISCRPQLS